MAGLMAALLATSAWSCSQPTTAERTSSEAPRTGPIAIADMSQSITGQIPPTLRIDTPTVVSLQVTNPGPRIWPHAGNEPVRVGYMWMKDGKQVAYGDRVPIPQDLAPGSTVKIDVPVKVAVPPGQYTLVMTAMQENNWWFADAGKQGLAATVTVQ